MLLPYLTPRVGHRTSIMNDIVSFRIFFLSQFDSFRFWSIGMRHYFSNLYLGFCANTMNYASNHKLFTILDVYNFNLHELFLMVLVVALYVAVDLVDYLLIIYKAWLEIWFFVYIHAQYFLTKLSSLTFSRNPTELNGN